MPLPSFSVTGNLNEIPGVVVASELLTTALTATLQFTPNIKLTDFVVWESQIYRVDPVSVWVSGDGSISDMANPVRLLANDAGLNISGLQWKVTITTPDGGKVDWWFDAPADGETVDLATVIPVPPVNAGGVTRGLNGYPVDQVHRVADTLVFQVQGNNLPNPVDISDLLFEPGVHIVYVDSFAGSDPTGATFSDTAVAAARTALGTDPGVLVFGGGYYKLANSVSPFGPGQAPAGYGEGSTVIRYSGSGDCFRFRDTRAFVGSFDHLPGGTGGPGFGGRGGFFTIDGTGAGASACGIHAGDLTGLVLDDVAVVNFSGASAIGVWLDNRVTWFEDAVVNARVENCTNAVIFDVNGGQASFGYGAYQFFVSCLANQNGVQLRNGAYVYNQKGKFSAVGGFIAGATNTGTVLKVSGTSSLSGDICVKAECNGSAGQLGHKTIVVDSTAELRCRPGSELMFINGASVDFQDGDAIGAKTTAAGLINVDGNLGRQGPHHSFRATGLITGGQGYLDPGGDLVLDGGNWFKAQMTAGAHTITILTDEPMTRNAGAFDLFIQQPASGTTTLTWPAGFTWLAGAAPVLSTVHNAVDHIHVTTADFVTYYARHVNAGPANQVVYTNPSTLVSGGFNEYLGSSPITATLPTAASSGQPVTVKNLSTAVLTINRAGSDVIHYDYASKTSLTVRPGGGLVIVSDGFEWSVVSAVLPTLRIDTVASSATPTINTDLTDQFNITALAAAITSMTTNLSGTPADGQGLDVRIKGTATRAITWGASFTGTLLSTTSGTNTHLQRLKYDAAAAKWAGYLADTSGY